MADARTHSGFFERAVTIHRADCETLALKSDSSGFLAAAETPLPPDLEDAVAGYVLAARRAYDGMRRQIGHLAGLLILAEAGGREVLAVAALSDATEKWETIRDVLDTTKTPPRLEHHRDGLLLAHQAIGEALADFGRIGLPGKDSGPAISARLNRAYRILQGIAEPQAGMTMVDFSHACCSCGKHATGG
ncbi:hypothetical protein [Aurantimonas sp. VKM B-3413]|uniref:hypothetical protein n=1 Tax=Aurantimonas sp. VKM B-3413 TaxID=2779401 RepID=UPI001E63B015|nr:hypothetical protein [Aurantimonas sp. VKM B-3413]MCB8840501.1 hypothetical protein [Aurantimonas sp. VKM B-3413]